MPLMFHKLMAAMRSFTFLRTAAGTLSLKIGAAGLGFVNSILLARLLGPAEFGVYSIVLSVVNFAATITLLGLPMIATRETAANAEHGQWSRLKGYLHAAHRWTMLATLAVLGVSAALLAGGVVKPMVSWPVIVIAMLLVPLIAFNQLRAAILRGLHWVVLADIPELLLRPVAMLLLLGAAYLTATHATAAHALGMQLATAGLALAAGTWWLITREPASLKTVTAERHKNAWLMDALPFLGIALISTLEGQVTLYLLGYLGGSAQAGLFQAASQLVGLIAIGLGAVNMPLQPKLAAAWARRDKAETQRLISETARMSTLLALPGVLLMLIFAEALLRMYGAEYVDAAQAMRILAIGQMVNAAAGSCGILLMMTGHQRVAMQGLALALLLSGTIAYLAIPHFGVTGGAMAATLGMIFWNVFYAAYALNRLGLNTTILHSK